MIVADINSASGSSCFVCTGAAVGSSTLGIFSRAAANWSYWTVPGVRVIVLSVEDWRKTRLEGVDDVMD